MTLQGFNPTNAIVYNPRALCLGLLFNARNRAIMDEVENRNSEVVQFIKP